MVRSGANAGLEKHVSAYGNEQEAGISSFEGRGLVTDSKSMVEVPLRPTSDTIVSEEQLRMVRTNIREAAFRKIADRSRSGVDTTGAMKPQFRKTVMDLVDWHRPLIMVITETRMSSPRADEIIETLPFDGAIVTDTIGAIFASPRFTERCLLWDNLKMLASLHNLPWSLMGDFNEVLSEDEKLGGNVICQRRVRAIQECMDACQMMDLGFSRPKFTWSNKRGLDDLIQCRLDSHNEFPMLVRESWNGQEANLPEAISVFTSKAQRWNKEVFGNVFKRKRIVMARLLGIQKALSNCPNAFLINLQNKLNDEYNLILQLEEELWAMKARTDWIIHGEHNTAYFHMSTLVHNIEEVKDIFVNYFKKLYQTEQSCSPLNPKWDNDWCATLSMEEANAIAQCPSDEEIWGALKTMKPSKAPGADGLHADFFQRFWLSVRDSVRSEVKNIFSSQQAPDYLNQTLIVLIPKVSGPELVSQYRPISLSNTVYKIVTKILV
ncbi:uncharacterized protein LOC111990897 [Quercus suber]|uniref:uncharacterized protein LOC111990897 n=1 Tax=Quercus suber TaxID=58331 RepID=UPI0032DE4A28